MAKLLGFVSAGLLLLTWGKFIWRRIPVLKRNQASLNWMVMVHPYAAGALVLTGLVHGIVAFGYNFLFTGYALMALVVMNVLLGTLLSKRITKTGVLIHRRLSYAIAGALLLHNLYKFIL